MLNNSEMRKSAGVFSVPGQQMATDGDYPAENNHPAFMVSKAG